VLDAVPMPSRLRVRWPSLAADDRAFSGSAREWGERCFVHLRAGRHDEAEAACFAGLQQGGSNRTRGALTYTLGRIEEARGNRDRALVYYERSDNLRPGNAAVQARLAALRETSTPP
jgi:tetratricopeptide (TPR) repeat protein